MRLIDLLFFTLATQTGADAQAFEDEAEKNDVFPGTNFMEEADNSQVNRIKAQHNFELA